MREWLEALPVADRNQVDDRIRFVQFGWPLGMPFVRKLERGLWEMRIHLNARNARIMFTIFDAEAVLLHVFIKKTQKTPLKDLELGRARARAVFQSAGKVGL